MDRQTDRKMGGWADVRMDGWMNRGGLVRWMDEKNMISGTSSSTIPWELYKSLWRVFLIATLILK